MKRTLKDRLWARGLNPHTVKRSGENMVRSIFNMRGMESLAEYREYRKRNPQNSGYALRMARMAIQRMREADIRWRELGGRLP